VKAKDGRTIESWLVPAGPTAMARGVPLILEKSMAAAPAYGPVFATDNQLYAAGGYAGAVHQPAGSTSYGRSSQT
jgi:hypothetical protein